MELTYEKSNVHHLGKLYLNLELEPRSYEADVLYLVDRVHRMKTDGFVMDQYTLWTTTFVMKAILADLQRNPALKSKWKPIKDPVATINFFLEETMTTPVKYSGADQLTYGALVKNKNDYLFLKHAVKDKRFRDHSGMSIIWSYLEDYVTRKKVENALFSLESNSFHTALMWAGCVISCIVFLGLLFDLKRTGFSLRKMCSKSNDDDTKCLGAGDQQTVLKPGFVEQGWF